MPYLAIPRRDALDIIRHRWSSIAEAQWHAHELDRAGWTVLHAVAMLPDGTVAVARVFRPDGHVLGDIIADPNQVPPHDPGE